jgi:hypothetical protein
MHEIRYLSLSQMSQPTQTEMHLSWMDIAHGILVPLQHIIKHNKTHLNGDAQPKTDENYPSTDPFVQNLLV